MAETNIYDIELEIFRPGDMDLPDEAIVEDIEILLEVSDGVPFTDISSAKARFRVKAAYSDTTPLINLTESDGITLDEVAGTLTIVLTVGHMDLIMAEYAVSNTDLYYDIDLYDDNMRIRRLYKGALRFKGDI